LDLFFKPQSVAFIGISARTGVLAFNALENLLACGYEGRVYPVNPNADEILGLKAYPDVKSLPEPVDLAVISTRRSLVPGIVKECVENGIKAIIVVGQGFSDANDDEGRRLEEEIVRIARAGGARILGPNTIGVTNPFFNFTTSFVRQLHVERLPIGLICQSGIFFGSFCGGLRLLGKGIDVGNASDVGIADCIEYFENDEDVRLIVVHVEGVRHPDEGRSILEAARRVSKRKPIIVLKTGRGQQAASAVSSHTASLVGDDDVWDAALKQCGVLRARNLDELHDLTRAFCSLPSTKVESVVVVTLSGGMGVMALDACDEYGLKAATLSAETLQKLREMLPAWLEVKNPVDIFPAIMAAKNKGEVLMRSVEAVLSDENVDALLLIAGTWLEEVTPPLSDVLKAAGRFGKPVVWCPYLGWAFDVSVEDVEQKLKEKGVENVATLPTPERAVRALAALRRYAEFKELV